MIRNRIPTRLSLTARIYREMRRSWLPAIAIYAFIFAALAAANY